MAVKKKKDEELQQSQPQRNSTYSYGRENGGNAYTYGSKGELVSTGKNVYSSTKGYNQKASFVAYDKKTSGSTKQRTSGSSWTPGGSNPTGAQKYNPATMERIKSDTTLYKKWYSGSQPTLRETVARMYQVADGDEKKFAELEGMLYQEMGSKGSVIYNPYMQATNYKAIEGLQELGIDLSGGVTSDWLAANMGLLDYGRQTTTSYGPSAPTKSSTAQQDAAYWFNTLLKAEERTQLAETEYKSLADEVKYWADLGYSDKEIVNRVRDNFGGKYKTLNTMDEDRIMGDATLLNRAVNYSGDDTIYGMIWAARNDGGSGDYFVDSVKYTMNEGNLYKRNRDSEAARDPSSYENFDPYSYSANTHDLNQKYGVTSYDTAWLEAHRSMLADPDKAEDWRDMNDAVENYNAATVQLTALDQWLEKQVADGNDSATIEAKLAALIADGDSVWYANPDTGKREQIKLTTLQKMEDKRAEGTYLALSGAVPFTLPQYIEKAQAMVAERDAAKAQKEAEEAENPTFKEKFTEGVQNFVGKAGRFLASMGIKGVGSYGEPIDSALEAQENAYDANTIGKNFASSELGVEIHGDLKPYEQAAVNDMVAKVEIATQPKATQQQIDEANAAVAVLQDLLVQAANDPARQEQESYKTSEAWTSVVDALQNPREGMDTMVAEPTAFLGELESQQQPQSVEDLPQMQAYANILQGGEWNGAVVDWAFAHSNNNNAIMAELVNGIIGHKTKGQELTGIAKSWWDKFGGLVDDLGGPETYDQLDLVDMGLADYDSRTAYGTQVFGALQMNEEAYEADAITPEQYAQNLIRISDLAEGISEMTDGVRATDEQADSFLENVEGASGILEKVYDVCNTGMEEQRKDLANDQRQREARNIEVLRQYTAGEGITDQGAFFDIMLTDTTEAAANDKAYQDASAFFGRTLGFDGIADDGIAFTTGDTGMDASYGKDFLLAEGASLYSKGVTALAQATLDTHMKFATACGMSLEQFYQEFPEYARTPGQIAAEARSEYHGAWGEFGMTIEGLVSANDSIMNAGADIEGAPTGEQSADTLDVSDLIALAQDKVIAIGSLNLDKTLYMMQHGWKDEEAEHDILLTQHGSREGVAAEWDKVIGEREQNLRNIYENDITAKQKGLTYEQWREGNTDKALDELMAKRDTAKDILDLGDPAKWSSEQAIIEKTGNIANIDKLVAENGSEFDKKVYDGVTGLMQTGQFMYQSVMLGGGYGASLVATLTSSGADAFDRFQESGDYDAALLASAGAWLVNAAIETSLDRFAPAALGGDREWKMMQARANLSKLGVFGWMKDPKSMSKAAQSVLNLAVGGVMNAGGEGVEEALQALVDSMADNVVYGTGLLPTGEQFAEAGQAFVSGAAMGAVMEGGSNLMFGAPVMTDHMGNAISKAEAQLLPETDGVILNTAIDFEATAMAIANSGDALAQVEQSSENQQLQEVTKELQEIDVELTEAETELAAAEQEQADAALALEAADNERVENDVFTEDMSKRMVAAATNLQAAGEKVSKSRERAEAARNRKVEAQKHHDELKAKVQGMYNQVMDEAKSHYAEVVAEKYYGNDTTEQQSASNAYLEACKEMQDIKKKLAEARAEMNTYGTGTPRGEQARKNYGKRLLELDKAAEKVGMAKASMDAAYDNSPEVRMENVHNAELAKAEQIAMEAAEAAAADPMNVRKAQAADVEQAKLDTIRAKQEMEEARSGISQRLNSPDSKVRDQAVADWKALQQKASDAAARAQEAEAVFNETDTQKNLRQAIDNMKQYSNEQLVLDDAEGHQDAVRAYNELQLAMADAELETRMNELNAAEVGSKEYTEAVNAYQEAAVKRNTESGNIQAWRNTGDGFGDHRGPARTGVTTTADRNPIEILSDLTSRIRIGYNPGGSMNEGNRRLPRAVQGFYSRHARSITTRTNAAGDLEIGLHEFGHAVQQRLPNLHANQQLLNGLSQGVRNTYDQRELDGEAIAEFVVDYIFSRDEAVRQAGAQFVQDFEDMMANDRDLYDAVMDASHQTELWNNADVGSKMDAMIKEGNDPRRGQIGNALQRLARNIETAVADLTAPADLVSRDFRRSALYSMHASRRADVSLTRFLIDPQGRNIGQSLAERFYRAGVTEGDQAEVSRYALARHALDRRRRNRDVFSEAEFPTADLEAYIADVEANHPNIVAGADALTSFWNDFMDAWWVGTGMIDADDVATMRAMYPHYVPTFRVVGENYNQYGGRSSRFQMRRAVEGGSSLEVIDPIASIVKMTQQMTSTVTQNQLMREFHNEWRRGGLGEIADDVTQDYHVQRNDTTRLQGALDAIAATGMVDPALMDDAYAQMLNLQERWYGTGQNYDANVVSGVDENGNRFFYKIKDRDLYNLLSGAANRDAAIIIPRVARNVKNLFTKMTTGSNPLFALKNMQRDIQASVNTGTHSLTYADGMYRWLRAFHEVLTGSDTYREWQAMGGGEHTRFNTELNGREAGAVVRELGRDLMRGRVTRRGEFRTRNTALENISNVLTLEQLNNAVENASRYVEYRFGRHDLGTDAGRREAFMASQDVTTNFGTHGASRLIRNLNTVVPFMNATIQGLNKDVNIIRDALSGDVNRRRQAAPKAAKTLMNTALTAALQYALLKMFGSNEDDEDYELLSQEMRTGNLIIPIGKAAMEELGDVVGFDKPYIRIPIAQGPLAQGMYAKALDLVADVANYSPMEVDMWRAAKSILSDSIPDGTVFQAISDAKNNRTWYGGEIESEYMRNYSVTNRYDSDTPRAIIELGQMLNVSPAKLDYLLNQYSGFAGKIIMPLLSTGRLNGEGGLDERVKNLAYNVLKNYTIDPVSSNDLSTSYTAAKATISQIIADGKAGKPMGDLAYSVDPDEAYSAAEYLSEEFTAIDKEIAALWSEYNAIKDSDMSDGDKARQMRDIRRNYIVPLQQDAMALYEEYKMQYIDADSLALEIYGRIPGGLTRPTLD